MERKLVDTQINRLNGILPRPIVVSTVPEAIVAGTTAAIQVPARNAGLSFKKTIPRT